ncbi:oligosaccharide flippase family protein [Pseudoalteromonas sp. BDTF-M6]|uniref:lipopolysaccharide biosynthesis protein n=1 Tax=Pseudoalteromonas sp. BDTF-M6 TaxID=2796132 RepID=UPI001BB01AF7|nr:oligosaccharide flippase family protein [Pseudoalteromonas sp. BDTF-M6]MBS3798480.1 oligosaccharide flippase family protein [Pseudoalteromonas sp. BDTF-M6]
MSHKRELVRNLASFGLVDLLSLLLPIVTMPILTRTLGASQYGDYLLLITVLYFGHTIVDYGTHFTAVRKIARFRDNIKEYKKIYCETQRLRFFLCFFYLFLFFTYYLFFKKESSISVSITLLGGTLYLLGYSLTATWFFQGMGRVDKLMKISLSVKLINFLVIVFFVRKPSDINLLVLSMSLPVFFGGLYLTLYSHKEFSLKLRFFGPIKKTLGEGRDVFLGVLAPNLYNSIPALFLGTVYASDKFASFAIASRLVSVVFTLQEVLVKAAYPIVSRVKESLVEKLVLANLLISFFPVLFIFLFGEWGVGFFLGSGFGEVNEYLMMLSFGIVFVGLSNSISRGYLLPNGFDRLYRNISIRVSLFSFFVCAISIYFWGMLGGAISISIARGLFFLDYLYCYFKVREK